MSFTKLTVSLLLAKFACAKPARKISDVNPILVAGVKITETEKVKKRKK